ERQLEPVGDRGNRHPPRHAPADALGRQCLAEVTVVGGNPVGHASTWLPIAARPGHARATGSYPRSKRERKRPRGSERLAQGDRTLARVAAAVWRTAAMQDCWTPNATTRDVIRTPPKVATDV